MGVRLEGGEGIPKHFDKSTRIGVVGGNFSQKSRCSLPHLVRRASARHNLGYAEINEKALISSLKSCMTFVFGNTIWCLLLVFGDSYIGFL